MNQKTLCDRVLHLEQRNRRANRLLLALVIIIGALPLAGFAFRASPENASFGIVYASKFVVRDPRTDKTRATLAHQTKEGGWAGMTLWDDEGQPRAEFKLWEDGQTQFLMMDGDRQQLLKLVVSSEGVPTVVVAGEELPTVSTSNPAMETDRASPDR